MFARLKEYLCVPKHGKVSEKVLLTRITVSVIFIVLYLAAMSITAYAYFAHSASTAVMTIQSASYDLTITPPDGMVASENNIYVLKNDGAADATYAFTLKRVTGENAGTLGYCKIKVKTDLNDPAEPEDVQQFYTKPIGTYLPEGSKDMKTVEQRTVNIIVAAGKQATVYFSAEMGTCTRTPIVDTEVKPEYKAASQNVLGIVDDDATTDNTTADKEPSTETTISVVTTTTTTGETTTMTSATEVTETTTTTTSTTEGESTTQTAPDAETTTSTTVEETTTQAAETTSTEESVTTTTTTQAAVEEPVQ